MQERKKKRLLTILAIAHTAALAVFQSHSCPHPTCMSLSRSSNPHPSPLSLRASYSNLSPTQGEWTSAPLWIQVSNELWGRCTILQVFCCLHLSHCDCYINLSPYLPVIPSSDIMESHFTANLVPLMMLNDGHMFCCMLKHQRSIFTNNHNMETRKSKTLQNIREF